MGTIKAWQSVVQQLKNLKKLAARREQHVAQGKTRAAAADADTLDEVTEQMRANLKSCRGLEVDNAEWEKLVLELKVPEQLARICMVDPSNRSHLRVFLVGLDVLHGFVVSAGRHGLLLDAEGEQQEGGRAALGGSISQQLQGVGLPEHVLQLTRTAVSEVQAGRVAHGQASSSSSRTAGFLLLCGSLFCTQWLFQCVQYSSVSDAPVVELHTAAAAGAELIQAVLGCTDWFAQETGEPASCWFWSSVNEALTCLRTLLQVYQRLRGPCVLHAVPHATRMCGLLAILHTYCHCLEALPLPAEGHGSTTSSSSSSSSSRAASPSSQRIGSATAASSSIPPAAFAQASDRFQGASDDWVWQVASTNVQQLPDVAPALAKHVGLSKLQLACIAAHLLRSGTAASGTLGGIDMAQVVQLWGALVESAAKQAKAVAVEGQSVPQAPFRVVEGLAQLELSTLLIDWVAGCGDEQQFVELSRAAVDALCAVLLGFKKGYYRQQQQLAGAAQPAAASMQLLRLLSRWGDSTMPLLLKTMARALDIAQREGSVAVVQGTAAGLPAAGSSSGSGGGGGSEAAAARAPAISSGGSPALLQSVLATLSTCVWVLMLLGSATAVSGEESTTLGHGYRCALAIFWPYYAMQAVSLLEAYVRLVPAILGTGLSVSDIDLVDAVVGLHSLCLHSPVSGCPGVLMELTAPLADENFFGGSGSGSQPEAYLCGFLSLLVSAWKLAGSSSVWQTGVGQDLHVGIASVCASIIQVLFAEVEAAAPAAGDPAPGSSSGAGLQQSNAPTYTDCLPWLVLLGRCCFQAGSRVLVEPEQQLPAAEVLCELGMHVDIPQLKALTGAQQLAAAGYVLQPVQERLVALSEFVGDRVAAAADGAEGGAGLAHAEVLELAEQLRAFGAAASSIPVPHFCNNPACDTVRGPSEAKLVSGRSCLCGRCRVARYCSRDCQAAHFKQHKHACKAMAAAAVSEGAA